MPLTYAEYNAKRNNVLYWAEYGRTLRPTLNYLAAGMHAVADRLASQSPEQAQEFREMGDAMYGVMGETDTGSTSQEISDSLATLNKLYPFLEQSTGGVPNRQLLEQALADNPGLRSEYLTTEETRDTTFQQQLDNVGDFFVISQRAIDEQMERIRRENVIRAAEERRTAARQRIEDRLRDIPAEQRAAEEERLWQEFEQEEQILSQGADYALQQEEERQRREEEERQRREEEERRRQEEERRRQEEERLEEEERQRQQAESRRREEEAQRRETELRQRQVELRRSEGPFAMPAGYDYRDAAIHFTRGMQSGDPQASPVAKMAEKIHARRQALEEEVNGIVAEVDRQMPPDILNDGFNTIRKIPDRREILERNYGSKLRENLEKMPGEGEEKEIRLFADMVEEQLLTEKRRSDLLERFPARKELNAQLEPHRVQARRNILERHFGKDLELRMRQTGNELAANTLLTQFFLDPKQAKYIRKALENTFGPELDQKLAACTDKEHPEDELFRKEIFEPALRDPLKWQQLGNQLGLPWEIDSQHIPDVDTLVKISRMAVKKEKVEEELFKELVRLHPEAALEDQVSLRAEQQLYAALHPEEPILSGSKLLSDWARDQELKLALGDKKQKLEELRKLDDAASGLKKECLAAAQNEKKPAVYGEKLADASRYMKSAMIGLYDLHQKDPELFKELAGELDEEWVKMDLVGSKKIREEHKIPEQYLLSNGSPAKKPLVWPFKPVGTMKKPAERPFVEYELHAFDKELPGEKWTDEKLDEEKLEHLSDEYSFVENDIPVYEPTPIENYMSKEWDKLSKVERRYPDQVEKCLSRIVAADTLFLQGKNAPSEKEIDELADKLRENGGLKQVAAFVDPKILAKSRRPDLILNCMQKAVQPNANNRQVRRQKLKEATGPAVEKLLATGKGKSYFFGIPRFLTGNSTRYENALAAMQTVQKADAPDQALVDSSAETVKEYLRDKMTKRDREFGNIRWKQCMTFLKYAMPRKEFEAYCLEVNRARGATNPEHEDYVSPEMFGPPQTVGELREEILARVRAGEGTRHDLAMLGAMKSLQLKPEAQPDLTQLLKTAHAIEGKSSFGLMMTNAAPGLLLRMAEKNDGEALARPEDFTAKMYNGVVNSLEGFEEPVGLEKEMLDIATEGRGVEEYMKSAVRDPKRLRDPNGEIIRDV